MKNTQAFNPFLPLTECIPDGEPHVFGDRIYLFGSHDRMGGSNFCLLPYVFYSAPTDNPKQWTARGVSYRAEQDPAASSPDCGMYAPDVVRGNDGKYYLYYCLGGYESPISVAVCDTPDGEYRFYGVVRNPDGSRFHRCVPFDPAVLNDDGRIRLYYGTWFPFEDRRTPENSDKVDAIERQLFGDVPPEKDGFLGPVTVELADDMLTVLTEPKHIAPERVVGTSWEAHPFFEASSVRKIGSLYYFIYSSWFNHELCYATSERPDGGFTARGTIISNGDIGLNGRSPADRLNYTGNNHGSIERIGDQWYIFYHRQTHDTQYSRQACAEPIQILPDGSIPQVEMTSCGLNGGPLRGEGVYPAAICCNLTNGHMPHSGDVRAHAPNAADFPQLRSGAEGLHISGMTDGSLAGYKYFAFTGETALEVTYRAETGGALLVKTAPDGGVLARLELAPCSAWETASGRVPFPTGRSALYLEFAGGGKLELLSLRLG